jgi:ABC-type branched-subunit amino acid transport system ATPase component/ABC-type branched-subunit amino acid transport system permease subunit
VPEPARRLLSRPELLLLLGLVLAVTALGGVPLGIATIGVVSGCVLALHAMGIVLLYSRTRVLSFAQFGLGAAASVFFYLFVVYNQWAVLGNGICHCLAPHGASMGFLQHHPDPFRAYLGQHHPWMLVVNVLISAALGIALAAYTGSQVYKSIAQLFARAPRIVPTVATLAFAVALGGAANLLTARTSTVFGWHMWRWLPWGPVPGTGEHGKPALPEGVFVAPHHTSWTITMSGGARFHVYEILAIVIAVLALVALTLRFRVGKRGLYSRATAANIERAATLGVDVDKESRGPWRVAGALSGFGALLSTTLAATGPAVGLDMSALTLVLAAVVLARMSSIAWALVASVALGVLDQGMFWHFHSHTQFDASLVVLIGVALVIQRGRLSRAERDAESVFTTAPEPLPVPRDIRNAPGVHGLLRGTAVVVAIAFLGYPVIASPRQLSLGIGIVALMVVGLSLLVISGWAGQVSLGQMSLGAVGGYVVAVSGGVWHVPMLLALLLGAIAAALVAPVVGLPALRLPGPFVAIMTLALALAVPALLLNPQLLGSHLPNTLSRPVVLGIELSSDRSFYWFTLLVLLASLALVTGLRRSRLRRVLIAARDNQQAAAAFGVDVTRLRLEAFAVSGFLAGLGGGLVAYANSGVQADTFSAVNSVALFLVVVVGGLSAVSGPVLGAAVFGLMGMLGTAWVGFLNGLGTVFVLAVRPGGLAGIVYSLRDAAIRVVMHLQGHDVIRVSTGSDSARIAIAERGPQSDVVDVRYRLLGDGYGPVEGTRLRTIAGADEAPAEDASHAALPVVAESAAPIDEQVEEALAVLRCHRLDVAYGGAVAVSGVSLTVAPGEVLAIVGLNGAGKTSLLRALAGLEPAAHGTVEIDGTDVTQDLPHKRAQAGLGYVPGGAAVLPTLTVRENLVVAGADDEQISTLLARFPMLEPRLGTAAGNLSGGEQQVLAVVQAVVRRPRALLVDELSLGLSAETLDEVLALIAELAQDGTAVVLVEQSINTAMAIADTALFLENGRSRYYGPAQALRDHPELFSSIAFGAGGAGASVSGGGSEIARAIKQQQTDREAVLRMEGLTAAYGAVRVVDEVSMDVHAGEVVGVLGPNGAGKTSLFDCLSGTLPVTDGTVTLLGEDVTSLAPHKRAVRGLMRSFQSVRLFPSLSVRDNIAVALETRLNVKSSAFAALWLPPARAEERRVDERVDMLLELLQLEKVADTPVSALSLGQRRMVDLACQLAARPKVLLLDEPASGLAHGETELLGPLVSRISSDLDCAVLIIEHNVQVLASVAHRLVAMRAGAVIADGAPADVLSDPAVRNAYFGAEGGAEPRPLVPTA